MSDKIIHLSRYKNILKSSEDQEDSVTVPVWITQSAVDGLHDLLIYLDGLTRGGPVVPGHFETVMFYRTIRSALGEANCANNED